MRITKRQLRRVIREAVRSGLHPSDWNPNPMLPSRYEFGADMVGGGVTSSFKTKFGTYYHEPADDDIIYFVPKGKQGKDQVLGSGNFNDAKALAVKHHDGLSAPRSRVSREMSYDEEVAAALQQKKANFKIDIHPRRMGRIGGSVDFAGGKLVQFDMRDLGDGVVLLVMEAMGPEETGEWYGDESVKLPFTGDPSNDADLVMRQLVAFIEKYRDDLGY